MTYDILNDKMKTFLLCLLMLPLLWLGGRVYYFFTDGFRMGNIRSSYAYHPSWEARSPTEEESCHMAQALSQNYRYLGKGCQSYVFVSDDEKYVLKFFKLQRYRISPLLRLLPPLASAQAHKHTKQLHKEEKRERFFQSWKLAYNELAKECGLVYLHLNRSNHLQQTLTLTDKMGKTHLIALNEFVFLIQHRATPLSKCLQNWPIQKTASFLDELTAILLSEYQKGLIDADPALLQNTGVHDGKPIHLDVGQWMTAEDNKTQEQYKQGIYDRLLSLHTCLKKKDDLLAKQIETSFFRITGTPWETMQPCKTGCY